MASEYDGKQFVGIDLHRRRSVIVRQDADAEVLEQVRIDNDAMALACEIEKAGADPEVALEATYGCTGPPMCSRPVAPASIWPTRWG